MEGGHKHHHRRKRVGRIVEQCAQELKHWASDTEHRVATLKRVTDGTGVGALEFRHALSDLDDKVSELQTQTQHLERFTVDSISMEELLGHCSQLYQSNRTGMERLQAHLQQYGYQPQPLRQPSNPMTLVQGAASSSRAGPSSAAFSAPNARQAHTPHLTASRNSHPRGRQQTPGVLPNDSPLSEEEEGGDVLEVSFKQQFERPGPSEAADNATLPPGTTRKANRAQAPAPPATAKAASNRYSLASSDSSTPEAFMSPSLAALQAKYAADNQAAQGGREPAGAQDHAPLQGAAPGLQQQLLGHAASPRHPALFDPHGSRARGPSPPAEDDTCSLYQQLIRSKDVPSSITTAINNSNTNSANAAGPPPAPAPIRTSSAAVTSTSTAAAAAATGTPRSRAMAMAASAAEAKATKGHAPNAGAGSAGNGSGGGVGGHEPQGPPRSGGPSDRSIPSHLHLQIPSQMQNQQQQQQRTPRSLLRSPSGGCATEAMAASRNQPLAEKLASLEMQWVTSGQAGRSPTPKRAAASAQAHPQSHDVDGSVQPLVSREAAAMAMRMSSEFPLGSAARASDQGTHHPAHSASHTNSAALNRSLSARTASSSSQHHQHQTAASGHTEFEFAPVQPRTQPPHSAAATSTGLHGKSAPHATPAWPHPYASHPHAPSTATTSGAPNLSQGSSFPSTQPHSHTHTDRNTAPPSNTSTCHITPSYTDSSLLGKYASHATPSLSSANLSPGTSSLLSRVFGTSSTTHSSEGSAPGTASVSTSKPLPFQQPPHPHRSQAPAAPAACPPGAPPPPQEHASAPAAEAAGVTAAPPAPTEANSGSASGHSLQRDSATVGSTGCSTSQPVAGAQLPFGSQTGVGAQPASDGARAVQGEGLALVSPEAYASLPMFLRTQLPLDLMNSAIEGVCRLLAQTQGQNEARAVTMVELEGLGLDNQRSKVFVNALCKLGKCQMQGSTRFLCLA